MKKIIKLTESDLTRIVKRVLMEQGENTPYQGGRKTVATGKDTLRAIASSGEIDYNYIENQIPIDSLHELIYDAITMDGGNFGELGDDEAVVEAAFLRILKEKNPLQAYQKVSNNYLRTYRDDMYTDDMWGDIKYDINVFEKYHKQSLKKSYDLIQKSKGDEITPTPANDKLCKYSWDGPDDKDFYTDMITEKYGFESVLTFQKWCKNDAKLYSFKNKNNKITNGMCGNPDGKIGCCTVSCYNAVKSNSSLYINIKDHAKRANRLY